MKVKPKSPLSSKTIWVGGFCVATGSITAIIQALDFSKSILTAAGGANVPPDVAVWIGLGLAIVGAINVWLRTITDQPIGKPPIND